MQYVVGVVDKKLNRPIIEGAHADHIGVKALLENLTDLDEVGRNEFLRSLIGVGFAAYEARSAADALPYNITAVKR